MGYANNNLRNGNIAVGAQFVSISDANGLDIQTIVPNGVDLTLIAISTLNYDGTGNETFVWDDWQFDAPCWADENGVATKKFAPGEGVWAQGRNGYALQSAGQVGTDDIVINLVNGNVMAANTFPIGVNIQDIVPTGDDLSMVAISTLNYDGTGNETFIWDDWQFDAPCWADDNGVATKVFAPGEGMWVQGRNGYTLRIPAPEL